MDFAALQSQVADNLAYASNYQLQLVGTARTFAAVLESVGPESQTVDYTPSDDEECIVHIAKSIELAAGADPQRGQSFYDAATGLYYEIMEAHRKGPHFTSRYRCRIVREYTP